MANKRIRKKTQKNFDRLLDEQHGAAMSIYSARTIPIHLSCPDCGKQCLSRTYIPTLGSMNGSVSCASCGYTDSFVSVIADDMGGIDPLPREFGGQRHVSGTAVPDPTPWRAFLRWIIGGPVFQKPLERKRVSCVANIA